MKADIEHPWILIEDLLCPVPMVDGPVHNEYLVDVGLQQELLGRDGDRVEVAEPHCLVSFSMVTYNKGKASLKCRYHLNQGCGSGSRSGQIQNVFLGSGSGLFIKFIHIL